MSLDNLDFSSRNKDKPWVAVIVPHPASQQACQEIYDILVYKKLLKLQEAVDRLNAMIRRIAGKE